MLDRTMDRAWATLEIKRLVDTAQREIAGIASTPEPDRLGDIVESEGLEFSNPLPLLWQHRHDSPVGWATLSKPTKAGVSFTAKLAKIDEPGALKDRVDEAWQHLKAGLVKGVSIGFRAIERDWMKDGGIRFIRSSVVELSLVTIPANESATISAIKSIDAATLALPGTQSDVEQRPAAVGKPTQPKAREKPMTTIAENISAFSARRDAAMTRMNKMINERADKGETLDEPESTEYDGLKAEVAQIEKHLERLSDLERLNKAQASSIAASNIAEGSAVREPKPNGGNGAHPIIENSRGEQVLRTKPNCHPTSPFIRYCIALGAAGGNPDRALQYTRMRKDWHSSTPELLEIFASDQAMYAIRAAVPAGTTYDTTWAGPLVYAENLTSAFAEFLRPMTLIGRFATLRRVPFNIRVPRVTAGTSGGWVGEAAPKPITSMALDTITLTWAKAAAIVVITEELARFSNPSAEDMIRTDLSRSITQFLDRQFIDPSVAAVTGVSPGSITNGITAITPTGVNMAAFRADVKTLLNSLLDDNQSLAGAYWIMTQQQAVALSLAQNSLGQIIYPGIGAEGGTLLGYPVLTTENIPATGGSPADGYPLIFAIGPEILLADDGQVTIDVSREASVQMDGAPDSPPSASTNMQSLWQLNQIGIKAERFITWARRRSTAVAWIQNAKYAE